MDITKEIRDELKKGNVHGVKGLAEKALASGVTPKVLLDQELIAGMDEIGVLFKNHEIFLPDVLLAAKAMHGAMEVLKPHLIEKGISSRGTVVLGTAQGDLHDIGKNLVGIMLRGAGFEVIDLGTDVAPERFVETALTEKATIIGLSALLTTTMPCMKKVVEQVKERKLSGSIRVIIGGAAVSDVYAKEIGADAYGYDAASAVDIVKRMV